MKNNFWGLIWSSFREVNNSILTILSYAISILLAVVASKASVPLYLLIIIVTLSVLIIATLVRALQKALEEYAKMKQSMIPKILRVQKDANNNIECLLEASDLFAAESMISLYYTDEDDFERLIGVGSVRYINNKKRIQVVIDEPKITYQNILDKLANNDLKVMQKTRVSPSVIKKFNQP
ncbi:MAG: hypothetical protein GPJ11_18025 [Microcystis aeruginosa L211-101]|jgi:hypothetical protein|nr:hypothetical protein [Microcystis aeruginosa L211-11]NCR32703.1 hypothetical protein [Microcystis aeruginosa L211-101]